MRKMIKILAGWLPALALAANAPQAVDLRNYRVTGPEYTVQVDVIRSGYDGVTCWVHPRAGIVPSKYGPPAVVLTMHDLELRGSDIFGPIHEMRTDDYGRTWSGPYSQAATLGEQKEGDNVVKVGSDLWPSWHARSGKLLAIGHTVRYPIVNGRKERFATTEVDSRETLYTTYDAYRRTWTPWKTLAMPMPKAPLEPLHYYNTGAGSVQRVDLPDGDILLPTYFRQLPIYAMRHQKEPMVQYITAVMRCGFDGETLTVKDIGNELTLPQGRGLYEPSIIEFKGRFYLTLRNDDTGYVTVSVDGLNFPAPKPWCWDDGTNLGNYNTQQHWVTHGEKLYLVYTRRGANNDHVVRHRAPLFIGEVDPQKLVVKRATERILVPERGARLGNFGVTVVSPNETWVTVAEWMQTFTPPRIIPVDNPRGADNSVIVARIRWNRP